MPYRKPEPASRRFAAALFIAALAAAPAFAPATAFAAVRRPERALTIPLNARPADVEERLDMLRAHRRRIVTERGDATDVERAATSFAPNMPNRDERASESGE